MKDTNNIGNQPKISVIVPVYNVQQYLDTCISSIWSQTYREMEIILIDDGSKDESGSICDKWAQMDSRIIVVHQENKGLVNARKAGLSRATGRYIGFVDGDDYIDKQFYEHLIDSIQECDVDFVHSGFVEDKFQHQSVVAPDRKLYSDNDKEEILKHCIFFHQEPGNIITPSIWSKLYRADFIKKCYSIVPEDQSYGEDLLCLCKCILESNRFLCIDNAEYHYLVREDSMSHIMSVRKIAKEAMLMERIMDLLGEYGLMSDMKDYMEDELLFRVFSICRKLELPMESLGSYRYPTPEDFLGKKLVIYGAGVVGQDYYQQFKKQKKYNIVAWVDKKHCDDKDSLRITIDELGQKVYDYIVIAIRNKSVMESIKQELLTHGVSEEAIIWKEPTIYSLN